MNTHKNARLTFARRQEMVQDMIERQVAPAAAGAAQGITHRRPGNRLGRFLAQGDAGLCDASSRPRLSPRAIVPERALVIVELRRRRLTQARIARSVGVSESTVSRVLHRAGLSRWSDLGAVGPECALRASPPRGTWSIWIPKSWDASCAWGIASPAIAGTTCSKAQVGSSCSSRSMIMRA